MPGKIRSAAFFVAAVLLIALTAALSSGGIPHGSPEVPYSLETSERRTLNSSLSSRQSPHPTGRSLMNATHLCVLSRKSNVSAHRAYEVGNATVYVPEDIDLLLEWRAAAVASEMGAEELSQRMYVLSELLRMEFEGQYGEEFRRSLDMAEMGRGASYLWDVVGWEREGLSNRGMINETLKLIHGLIRNLSVDRFREGALFVLYELSLGREYVLTACDPRAPHFRRAGDISTTSTGLGAWSGWAATARPPLRGTPSSERPARPPAPPTWTTTGKRQVDTAIQAY